MAVRFNPFTGNLDFIDTTAAAGSDTQVQYNSGGNLAGSVDLTWDDSGKVLAIGGDIDLDNGGAYSTTLQMITPTADRVISFPNATGTVGLVAGSSGQLTYNNAGAYAGLSTLTTDGTNITLAGRFTNSTNGAASAPPSSLTGTWFSGGTATTTKPQLLIEPTGTTSTAWSTSGTGLGVNAPSGFTGNLLDLQVNGTSQIVATSTGRLGIGVSPTTLLHARSTGSSTLAIFGDSSYNNTIAITRTTSAPAYLGLAALSNTASITGGLSLIFNTSDASGGSPTEQLRITSDRYIRLASGTGGIQFNGDTAAANALDDYEEGTWTVNIYDASSGGNVSATSTTGRYTKIGNIVQASFSLNNIDTTGLTAGNVLYYSLPFVNVTNQEVVGACALSSVTFNAGYSFVNSFIASAGSRGYFIASGTNAGFANLAVSWFNAAAADVRVCLVYATT